jgi:hypothetical protein
MMMYGITIPIAYLLIEFYPAINDLTIISTPILYLLMYPLMLYPSYYLTRKLGYKSLI